MCVLGKTRRKAACPRNFPSKTLPKFTGKTCRDLPGNEAAIFLAEPGAGRRARVLPLPAAGGWSIWGGHRREGWSRRGAGGSRVGASKIDLLVRGLSLPCA